MAHDSQLVVFWTVFHSSSAHIFKDFFDQELYLLLWLFKNDNSLVFNFQKGMVTNSTETNWLTAAADSFSGKSWFEALQMLVRGR